MLFGCGRANEPLVTDDAGVVLVVRWPEVGGARRASIVGSPSSAFDFSARWAGLVGGRCRGGLLAAFVQSV